MALNRLRKVAQAGLFTGQASAVLAVSLQPF